MPVNNLNEALTKGRSSGNMKNKNIKSNGKLYLYKNVLADANLNGRKVIKSQWPSNGGIGNKLKTARKRFSITTILSSSGTRDEEKMSGRNLKVRPNRTARAILDAGPARATLAGPYLRSLKFNGLYGTGLAYPNMKPPRKKERRGSKTEPNISKCFNGFSVSRPRFLAVGSPKEYATAPWLTSCITTE